MHSRCFYELILALAETEPEISQCLLVCYRPLVGSSPARWFWSEIILQKLTNAPPHDAVAVASNKPSSATQTTSPPSARLQSKPSISPSLTLGTSFLM